MDWKHITSLALGIASLAIGAALPVTAPYLLPTGAALLLGTNARKLLPKK